MSQHQLRPLAPDDLPTVLDAHARLQFPGAAPDLAREACLALLETRWARNHVEMLGWYEGARLLGALRACDLEILLHGMKQPCVGLGSLVTVGGARGVAGPMVAEAVRSFQGRRAACLVFGGAHVGTLRSLGFIPIPNLRFTLSRAVGPGLPAPGKGGNGNGNGHGRGGRAVDGGERLEAEARPFQPSDLPEVVQVYNLDTSLRRLGLLRSEAYWEHLFEKERLERLLLGDTEGGHRTWVCSIVGRTAAYMVARIRKGCLEIVESPAESSRAQSWMLRYAVHLATTLLAERLEAQCPWRAEQTGFGMHVTRDLPVMMVHPLSSGLRADDLQQSSDNFLWRRDRF